MNARLLSIPLLTLATAAAASCGGGGETGTGGSNTTSSATTSNGSSGTSTSSSSSSSTSSASSSTSGGGGDGGVEPTCATTGQNLLLCEDFETIDVGGVPDPTVWKVDKGATATVAVDDKHARHGKHALHLHTSPDANKALLHETTTFPLPGGGNSLYGRANFMIEAGLAVPTNHTNFFEASGQVNGQAGNYRYGAANAKFFANYNPGDPGKLSQTSVPVGTWVCLEWAFLGDTNEMHFWIDGKEVTDIAVPETGVNGTVWTAPKFDSFYFGWITYTTDTASDHYDIWYDDIALDTARIGCDI
ncbi:secreted hydrolase [Minicystis rosea]|nr:secreted hydrolase [Minicystis rosea]